MQEPRPIKPHLRNAITNKIVPKYAHNLWTNSIDLKYAKNNAHHGGGSPNIASCSKRNVATIG